MLETFFQAPYYHVIIELFLICCVYRLMRIRPQRITNNDRLTEKEKQQLIDEWTPEPLVPENVDDAHVDQIVDVKPNGKIVVEGAECLNFGSFNFLNMMLDAEQAEAGSRAISKYGVGSCGPRGFFGTFDAHLNLEEQISKFLRVEEAILYSYGFSTIASAIPAYAKKGDILYVDECACFAIQQGARASRSSIKYFRHNDMEHLESLLLAQQKVDALNPRKAKVVRKFIVVEGIYTNSGCVVPIDVILRLKFTYKVRVFLDESNSFGVLGKHGRGVTEHFCVPTEDVDLISAELERAVGSVGGFCAGSTYVIDHQRLSGSGYVFSASLPPYLAVAASNVLHRLERDPSAVKVLSRNATLFHRLILDGLNDQNANDELTTPPLIHLRGDAISPIKHLYSHDKCDILNQVVQRARDKGIALLLATKIKEDRTFDFKSIRITISSAFSEEDIKTATSSLLEVIFQIYKENAKTAI